MSLSLLGVLALPACTSVDSRHNGGKMNPPDAAQSSESLTSEQVDPVVVSTGEATTFFNGRNFGVLLRIRPSRVSPGEVPEAQLTNTGEGEFGYSPGFKMEKRTDNGWRWINSSQGFTRPFFYLAASERSEAESLAVYLDEPEPLEFRPGLYRVTKSVVLAPGQSRPPSMKVSAQFRVIPR